MCWFVFWYATMKGSLRRRGNWFAVRYGEDILSISVNWFSWRLNGCSEADMTFRKKTSSKLSLR